MGNGIPQVLVGLGGWEHEVLDGCFYPQPDLEPLRKLAFYAGQFDFVEVRASFWDENLGKRDATDWIAAVAGNKRFQFAIKLHQSMTHKKAITPRATKGVRSLLHELERCGRLAGLLAQFPYSFTNTGANRFHLVKLGEIFSGFPVFVELRHASWDNGSLKEFLAEHEFHPVNVDLPRLKGYVSCRSDAGDDAAYLRLHGRNEKGWLLNGLDTRYDYLYNGREIREIIRRTEVLAGKSKQLFLVCNNTTGGKAIANAYQLKSALSGGKKLDVTPSARKAFPFLHNLSLRGSDQISLPVFEQFREVG
jgi:uncharacterized protein YecE (DUF72 family)